MTSKLIPHHSHWGAFLAEVEAGRFVGVKPFPRDPDPSALLEAMPSAVHSPNRIAQPMVREGYLARGPGSGEGRGRERFVPVPWERALDLVAGELARVKREHGHAAIMGGSQGWGSAGIFHDARTQTRRFLSAFGGFIDQDSNYSFGTALKFLPHVLGSAQAVGGPLTSWSSIARHARLVVLFGGANPKNMQVAKGGCGAHSVGGWMSALARAGVEVVNVSPIRDDGPEAARAKWVPIRPNTDVAMLLALTHTLVAEGLHDEAFLARYCEGFERVRPYLMGETDGQPKDAAWASAITGVPADTISTLARRMAAARTMLSASWSLQRADHGEQVYWAVILLASALGQIGLPGGGFGFGYGSSAGLAEAPLAFGPPAMDVLSNPLGRAIPAARIADCLLNPGGRYDYNGKSETYPDMRLVYWAGGNPFHHHQDINRLRRAWQRPETIVVHDPWWTATARHADIVLPATTTLERNDIGACHRDCYVLAMQQAIAPVGEARSDFTIYSALARRLGCEEAYTQGRGEMDWLRDLYGRWREKLRTNQAAIPDFDGFWNEGFIELPRRADEYVMLAEFREDPERKRLATPSGRIELYSERIAGFGYDDCPPHPTWLAPAEWLGGDTASRFPLHLVSSQPRYRLHSQMDGGPVSARGKVAGREAVAINPTDAARRGIVDGDVVRVFNARGACLAGAIVTDAVAPGVLRLSCGAWYDPVDAGAEPTCAHGNANVLTFDRGTSRLGQGPSCATTLVEIERFADPAPPVRAFVPPPLAASAAGDAMEHSELIEDLVAANRILADRGVFDAYGHISARDPGKEDRYWLARSMAPAQVSADDIIEFDLDNKPLRAGENRLFYERIIHGEIYKARRDVMAVCHNHSPSLIPLCNSDTRLRPMVGSAAFLGEGAPVFDIRTVDDDGDMNVCTVPQASALAQTLGAHWLVLLRGHGAVAVGQSVRQCVRHAIIAETNARAQIEATILGPVRFLTASEIAYARRMPPKDADRAWHHWKRKAMGGA